MDARIPRRKLLPGPKIRCCYSDASDASDAANQRYMRGRDRSSQLTFSDLLFVHVTITSSPWRCARPTLGRIMHNTVLRVEVEIMAIVLYLVQLPVALLGSQSRTSWSSARRHRKGAMMQSKIRALAWRGGTVPGSSRTSETHHEGAGLQLA